ncbi:MAG: type II toxin-antitoxin system YafQ family toxin [Clostridia bacterium]|nr:type II toxin-antitoxin system YafQ family toxin [Clostridia bacterium]
MSRQVIWTTQFKKDYKLAMKRRLPIEELDTVIRFLAEIGTLPEKYRDHELSGEYSGFRECHIRPDWLLIYRFSNNKLILSLTRTGTHGDLFG